MNNEGELPGDLAAPETTSLLGSDDAAACTHSWSEEIKRVYERSSLEARQLTQNALRESDQVISEAKKVADRYVSFL